MKAEKDPKTGKWLIQFRYTDWQGTRKKSTKRGFNTKREAEEWLRNFLMTQQCDFNMNFEEFLKLYYADMESRLREHTMIVEEIVNGVASMGGDNGLLVQTPAQFNSAIYSWVQSICQNAAMPIAYIVLALIFTLELYNASTRIDGAGGGATFGAEIVFKTMIKFVLCKLAVDMTPQILGAIFELSSNIIGNISGGAPGAFVAADLDALRAAVSGMNGMFPKLFLCVQVTIIWIVFKFSSMLITVVVIGRMVEIYIYMAIAAVPIATLGGGDLGMIGKNFLKSFAAVCVQGVLIYIAMSMFGTLAVSIPNGGLAGGDVTGVLFQCLLYSLVLVMAVFSSGRLAKSICNAM